MFNFVLNIFKIPDFFFNKFLLKSFPFPFLILYSQKKKKLNIKELELTSKRIQKFSIWKVTLLSIHASFSKCFSKNEASPLFFTDKADMLPVP